MYFLQAVNAGANGKTNRWEEMMKHQKINKSPAPVSASDIRFRIERGGRDGAGLVFQAQLRAPAARGVRRRGVYR
ncbi:MAG: hypothetical protein ACI3ZE_05510 [Candidatus Woodwardiibium sp.]